MADKTINQLTEDTTPTSGDFVASWDGATSATKKVTLANAARVGQTTNGAQTARVDTDETTTSTSYTDLATPGPAVTVTVGTNGIVLVLISTLLRNNTSGSASSMSFVMSGANTLAVSDSNAILAVTTSNYSYRMSAHTFLTGLNAGSTTFTCKYKVDGNSGGWSRRNITVIPL